MPAGPPVKFNVEPSHTGLLLMAVAMGLALTTAVVVTASETQPLELVTISVYTPEAAIVAFAIDGF